jgi:general secretion pathway protein B
MHMWDPDPAKRFVILDGERHVEGDSVGPMRIRRIDAQGVLFDWQGRAIRLPLR